MLFLMAITMKMPLLYASFESLLWLLLLNGGKAAGHNTFPMYISNKCSFPIWPATAPNSGHPIIASGGFYLPSGHSALVKFPSDWSGRVWARTGCSFSSTTVTTTGTACNTGDCDGRLACAGLIGSPPATLVEITLQFDQLRPSFYDVSLVDGYNLPVSVTTRTPSCSIGGCWKNLNENCPLELQLRGRNGEIVGCKSACLAFNNDRFCCRNEFGSADKCKPSVYSWIFKEICPFYVSYAFDSPTPLKSCVVKELVITFCPGRWGDDDHHYDSM